MKRVAILISGGGSNMVALAQSLRGDHLGRAVLVASNDPAASGLARAATLGIPVASVDHRAYGGDRAAFEAALLAPIMAARPDIICLAGFMRVLTADFIDRFAGQILNIHPSLLPKYPGLHTYERALAARDAEVGCSVHVVTPDLDAGPLLGQARVSVMPGDTPATLAARVLHEEHRLYPAVLRRFVTGDRTPLYL